MIKLVLTLLLAHQTCSVEINNPSINHQQYEGFPTIHSTTTSPYNTEKTIYLPPEGQTAIPFYPHSSNLPFSYLPPTEHKIPDKYPPQFDKQNYNQRNENINGRDNDEEEDNRNSNNEVSSAQPFILRPNYNITQENIETQRENYARAFSKAFGYSSNNMVERRDIKPQYFGSNFQEHTVLPINTQIRRTVPQPQTILKNLRDMQTVPDQYKVASEVKPQYAPYHQSYGNTNREHEEPIPILKLSSEMDIDGTFRYETLTGDQTHIMQQGHIENQGTENEEQVVEGSYSYVGDNGQTYTVHYIADANGFRATGDHLPVPPPMPEIIQRSVEYNIMEEAKNPSHVNGKHDSKFDSELYHSAHYTAGLFSQPQTQPQRSHFTGRQPEAFTKNFPNSLNLQNHNLQQSASTSTPVVAPPSPPKEQPKFTTNQITPQITFMASQGAHLPNPTSPNQEPSISRSSFTTPDSLRYLPTLISNRLAELAQAQARLQNNVEIGNRALPWHYQKRLQEMQEEQKKAAELKHTISRSSNDVEDDVLIKFEDMTPEQYARNYNAHIEPNHGSIGESGSVYRNPTEQLINNKNRRNQPESTVINVGDQNMREHINMKESFNAREVHLKNRLDEPESLDKIKETMNENNQYAVNNYQSQRPENDFSYYKNKQPSYPERMQPQQQQQFFAGSNTKTERKIPQSYIPTSQTVSTSYDYEDDFESRDGKDYNSNSYDYESKKLTTASSSNGYNTNNRDKISQNYNDSNSNYNKPKGNAADQYEFVYTDLSLTEAPIVENTSYQPPTNLLTIHNFYKQLAAQQTSTTELAKVSTTPFVNAATTTTTTEANMKDLIKNNIFLKNVNKKSLEHKHEIVKKQSPVPPGSQPIMEAKKDIKMFKPKHIKLDDRKKVDIAQLMNLVSLKNMFESAKLRPKESRQDTFSEKNDKHQSETNDKNKHPYYIHDSNSRTNYLAADPEQQSKLKAKVYKTLQRANQIARLDNAVRNLNTNLTPPKDDTEYRNKETLPPLGRAGPSMKSYLPPIYS